MIIGDSIDKKRFNIASIRLVKYVNIWLENLKAKRAKKGKEKLSSWVKLTKKFKENFLPNDYEQKKYL